jgi:hypothetical protein
MAIDLLKHVKCWMILEHVPFRDMAFSKRLLEMIALNFA